MATLAAAVRQVVQHVALPAGVSAGDSAQAAARDTPLLHELNWNDDNERRRWVLPGVSRPNVECVGSRWPRPPQRDGQRGGGALGREQPVECAMFWRYDNCSTHPVPQARECSKSSQ